MLKIFMLLGFFLGFGICLLIVPGWDVNSLFTYSIGVVSGIVMCGLIDYLIKK